MTSNCDMKYCDIVSYILTVYRCIMLTLYGKKTQLKLLLKEMGNYMLTSSFI